MKKSEAGAFFGMEKKGQREKSEKKGATDVRERGPGS